MNSCLLGPIPQRSNLGTLGFPKAFAKRVTKHCHGLLPCTRDVGGSGSTVCSPVLPAATRGAPRRPLPQTTAGWVHRKQPWCLRGNTTDLSTDVNTPGRDSKKMVHSRVWSLRFSRESHASATGAISVIPLLTRFCEKSAVLFLQERRRWTPTVRWFLRSTG